VVVKAAVARDDQVAAVRAEIAALRGAQSTTPAEQPMLDQIEGALLLDRDHPAAVALLERAIAGSLARAPSDVDRRKARAYAYSSLIFDAGRAGDWARAWRLFGEQSGAALERCGLAVATDAHTRVVVLRDASGGITGLYEGARAISELDAAHVVPPRLVDQLRGCAEVEVIARPPIEGSPAVLPPELAWSYRSGASAPTASAGPDRRLVIANVEPPRALGLPRLMPWRSEAPPDVMLEGVAATPPRVLAALADAGTIEIHAHGMINSEVSDASVLMLSPDPDGRYALTAAEIRNQPLRRSPLVILAACHAASAPRYRHELWGLPVAFLAAGARAVIASADVVADDSAGEFFDTVRARIDRVGSVSRALRDVRLEWLAAHPQAVWVRSLMVFR
jgi:hypothetical protein